MEVQEVGEEATLDRFLREIYVFIIFFSCHSEHKWPWFDMSAVVGPDEVSMFTISVLSSLTC